MRRKIQFHRVRVLAIDDDPLALEDLAGVIAEVAGMELIKTCNSVPEAFHYLSRHTAPDVIFCDIDMPGMDGLEAAKRLLGKCRLFVFVTGHAEYSTQAYDRDVDS